MASKKGFFESLFDLFFTHLVASRVIAFLYVVALILGALIIFGGAALVAFGSAALGGLVGELSARAGLLTGTATLLPIIASPLVYALFAICTRFSFELVVVVFRIAENTGKSAFYAQALYAAGKPGIDDAPTPTRQ